MDLGDWSLIDAVVTKTTAGPLVALEGVSRMLEIWITRGL